MMKCDNDEDDDDVTSLTIGQTGKTENVPIFHKNKKLSLQVFINLFIFFFPCHLNRNRRLLSGRADANVVNRKQNIWLKGWRSGLRGTEVLS